MESTRRRDTGPEVRLRRLLYAAGVRYRVDVSPMSGMRSRADLVIRRAKVAVFVDGCFWHGCPTHGTWPKANAAWWKAKIEANRDRDRRVDDQLQAAGWTVLRFWEHEPVEEVGERVLATLRRTAK
jgi:DNA mismatch endonuclease (patch repair protein)